MAEHRGQGGEHLGKIHPRLHLRCCRAATVADGYVGAQGSQVDVEGSRFEGNSVVGVARSTKGDVLE